MRQKLRLNSSKDEVVNVSYVSHNILVGEHLKDICIVFYILFLIYEYIQILFTKTLFTVANWCLHLCFIKLMKYCWKTTCSVIKRWRAPDEHSISHLWKNVHLFYYYIMLSYNSLLVSILTILFWVTITCLLYTELKPLVKSQYICFINNFIVCTWTVLYICFLKFA